MTRTKPKPAARHHEECAHHQGSLDTAGQRRLLDRIRRIEGQVRGIHRMIEDDRYCPDILMQMAAVQESIRAAGQVLLKSHLRHCVTDAVRSEDPARTEAVYEELTKLFAKYAR